MPLHVGGALLCHAQMLILILSEKKNKKQNLFRYTPPCLLPPSPKEVRKKIRGTFHAFHRIRNLVQKVQIDLCNFFKKKKRNICGNSCRWFRECTCVWAVIGGNPIIFLLSWKLCHLWAWARIGPGEGSVWIWWSAGHLNLSSILILNFSDSIQARMSGKVCVMIWE